MRDEGGADGVSEEHDSVCPFAASGLCRPSDLLAGT